MLTRRAQTIMEYVLLISIVTAAIVYMLPRIKRGTQSLIKEAADQIGDQAGAEQEFNDVTSGYLTLSNTTTKVLADNVRDDSWGWSIKTTDEKTETKTFALTNAGWAAE